MRIIFILFTLTAIISCTNNNVNKESSDSGMVQNQDKKISSKDSPNIKSAPADVNGCYMKVLKRDTFAVQLNQTGNTVSGKLTFDNYEKDGSTGSINGTVEGDIIKLWYNFKSEGMNSVMEIYFKKNGDHLMRGIGPVDAKGDTSYYINHSAIQYTQDQSFSKLSCEELSGKYN